MKFLVIDTTKKDLLVMLYDGVSVETKEYSGALSQHNATLLKLVDEILKENSTTLDELDFFACNVGPGSFTGIRLGATTLNAFHLSTKKPLIGYTVFEPYGHNVEEETLICLSAGHDAYYANKYYKKELISEGEITEDELKKVPFKIIKISTANFDDQELAYTIDLVIDKYNRRQFMTQLIPYYMKKSQAEREEEKRNGN